MNSNSDQLEFMLPISNKPKQGNILFQNHYKPNENMRYQINGDNTGKSGTGTTVREMFESTHEQEIKIVHEENNHSFIEEIHSIVL